MRLLNSYYLGIRLKLKFIRETNLSGMLDCKRELPNLKVSLIQSKGLNMLLSLYPQVIRFIRSRLKIRTSSRLP